MIPRPVSVPVLVLILFFLDVGWAQDQSCPDFDALMVGTNESVGYDVYTSEFTCEESDAYMSRIDLKWGFWIDSLQVTCSDGSESRSFANGLYPGFSNISTFGGGLSSISAYFYYDTDRDHFPSVVTLYGYDEDEGYPDGMILGPFA